jgi:hypothetical protein
MVPQIEKFNVKETSEMLSFLTKLTNAGVKALADGEVTFTDGLLILGPLKAAGSAIKDAKLIPSELTDLSAEELDQLVLQVQTELEVDAEFAKTLVVQLLKTAGNLALVLRLVRDHRLTKSENPVGEVNENE